MERQVLAKAEGQKIWGKKSPESLETSLDLERVVQLWEQNLKAGSSGAGKGGKGQRGRPGKGSADVRLSDDVGDYVCGLVYYTSLAEMTKTGMGKGNAVFLHVPPLVGDTELEKGREVVLSLILAMVEAAQ